MAIVANGENMYVFLRNTNNKWKNAYGNKMHKTKYEQ